MLRFFEKNIDPVTLEYERKFVIPAKFAPEIEWRLRLHPALFREINIPIHVTSCYFDTLNLDYFKGNVSGVSRRLKVRARMYSMPPKNTEVLPDLLTAPRLEYKIKVNMQRTKAAYYCPHLDKIFPLKELEHHLKKCPAIPALIREHFATLHPTAIIGYHRRYFRSLDGTLRLTLDTDITYRDPGSSRKVHANTAVLELKYNRSAVMNAVRAAEHLGLRISRNSKYINALDALGLS